MHCFHYPNQYLRLNSSNTSEQIFVPMAIIEQK